MNYIRKGGHISTRPRNDNKRLGDDVRDTTKSGTLASGAVVRQRRDDALMEKSKPLTREEFDAQRREEETINRERLRRLREEHEKHEQELRRRSIDERRAAQQPEEA